MPTDSPGKEGEDFAYRQSREREGGLCLQTIQGKRGRTLPTDNPGCASDPPSSLMNPPASTGVSFVPRKLLLGWMKHYDFASVIILEELLTLSLIDKVLDR